MSLLKPGGRKQTADIYKALSGSSAAKPAEFCSRVGLLGDETQKLRQKSETSGNVVCGRNHSTNRAAANLPSFRLCLSVSLSLSLPDELPVAVSDWLGPQGPGEPRLSV